MGETGISRDMDVTCELGTDGSLHWLRCAGILVHYPQGSNSVSANDIFIPILCTALRVAGR